MVRMIAAALAIAACRDDRSNGDVGTTEAILADGGVTAHPSASTADRELTRLIKRGIASNESMSLQAREVVVIAQGDGVVTLRGTVANEAEKAPVEAAASRAGATRIESELTFLANPGFSEAE
jgi:osmotically-inducible protein OsmY